MKETSIYQALRWAYQPVKASKTLVRNLSWLPRRSRIIREYLEQGNGFKGLHVGCGPFHFPGWINTDYFGTPAIDFPLDITEPLPFPDTCLNAVYSSEVIEHIERRKVAPFLEEVYRILKPGGGFRLTTPNLTSVCEIYLGINPRATLEQKRTNWLGPEFSPQVWINSMFRDWGHQWLWDIESLTETIKSAGFRFVEKADPQITHSGMPQLANLETRYGIQAPDHCWATSMILEAKK